VSASRQCWKRPGLLGSTLDWTTWAGSNQKASMRLMARATETTSGTTRMNWPRMPGISISGRKAAMVVSVAALTGTHISCTAVVAARMRSMPFFRLAWIASTTTTASSTSMPSTMTMPSSTAGR